MATIEALKQQAAERAVDFVQSGMVVGLGTGSTAVFAVRRIGALLAEGRLQRIVGIPTAEVTAREAERAGVPLGTLDQHPVVDITIDGADEIDPQLNLIKGLGGALLRERMLAASSMRHCVRYCIGAQPTRCWNRSASTDRELPAARASSSSVQA